MLQVKSEISGNMSDCTMATGVMGCDGILRGAIADIDLFDMFVQVDKREIPYFNVVPVRGRIVVDRKADKVVKQEKIGVTELARRYAAGLDLYSGEETEESAANKAAKVSEKE